MIPPGVQKAVLRIGDPQERHFGYFDLDGRVVRVAAPGSETIESLRSFFYPYIVSQDEAHHADGFYDLTAAFEPGLYDYIKANIPETPDDALTTVLRHDLQYQLRCFHSESREITIIQDEPLKLFYVVSNRGRATKVVATVGSRTRTGLLRVIRGAWVLGHDALIVHGCALEKHRRGIIVAGEKHAGKSTSLLNLCTRKGYNVVANDRVLLELNRPDERPRAIGVPTVINLRRDTVKPFPELQHLFNAQLLGVHDLAKALDVGIKREVEVKAVAFLSYDAGCRSPVFRRLSKEESHEMLAPHLFSPREYDWVRMMKIGEAAPRRAGAASENILKGVSCFQLISNETLLEDSAFLLDRVLLQQPR